MGKSLRDLLKGFQFVDEKFNPRNVEADMLSSKERGGELNIPGLSVTGVKLPYDKQYSLLTNNIVDIYGADAPRILLRGTVDLNKATKKIVNRAARIAGGIFGNNNAVGSFVRNSISGLVSVKQPSDTISGNSTENGLYSDILNARIDNSKNPITGLLTQFKTPSQFKAAIGDISNGKVKIGGAVVDELTNLSFKGLGWAAAKIGLGKQDAGKTKSLSQTLKDSINSNSTGTTKFPSLFAEVKATLFSNSKIKPTGIITGQGQFAKLQDFPNMYDDSPIKTGLTIDGVERNIQTSTGLSDNTSDYLIKNPIEKSKFIQIDRFNSKAGEMPQDSQLGFNQNSVLFVNRSQSFRGIYNNYQLLGTSNTNLNTGVGQTTVTGQVGELISTTPDKDTFLLVKSGQYDEDFIYKTPDIISKGKPKRFSERVLDPSGKNINYALFVGYKNRKATPINGDHRLKSALALASNSIAKKANAGNDLIKIRFGYLDQFTHLLSNITGFTDTPTISWGEAKPIGSPYKFYFYESFEREVSFKTQIYASSQEQLPFVWEKANAIMNLTKGNARSVAGIAGKICSLRIGDMFDSDLGFITSCTLNVPDISPWEIKNGSQLPFVCEMDISYKVIEVGNGFYGPIGSISTTAQNPDYQFKDFPTKSPPKPVPFVKSERQLDNDDLVKLEESMALDSKAALDSGLPQDIFVSNAVGNAVNKSNIEKQRLQEIENIQTEANRFSTDEYSDRIKIESKPKSSTNALGGADQ